jgi:hypothetical protein
MIKKVIALIFVSFFVMSGLSVLNQGNQNYNVMGNNINSFVDSSSFSPYDFSIDKSINYTNSISSAGQTFGCYDNSLYYIYSKSIIQLNFQSDKINVFLSFTSQPTQIEIYNNYMIIGYGSGNAGIDSTLFNIYNFSSNTLYTSNFLYDYYYLQFAKVDNQYIFSIYTNGEIFNCEVFFNPLSLSKISNIPISVASNQLTVSGNNNNLIFAVNGANGCYRLNQFGFLNVGDSTLNTSTYNTGDYFGNINDIIDLGNTALLGSESYYITDKNTAGITSYSYNSYSNNLFFSDSSYNVNFMPINITNYAFTKLPVLVNNSNYQEFCYNGKIVSVYLPIGSGNTVFNSTTYIINGNSNLIIVNKNNAYVYPLHTYNLNVKSYNTLNNQIQDYFSLNGIIYTGYSNSFSFTQLPQTLIPLNTSTYYYNGSAITIIQSDFSGSGFNLYYNLSIYYQEIKPASIPLYDIFTYMYPISIIGLFVGMGAFIFTIKKRGYKI